jgi:hypothetical protein
MERTARTGGLHRTPKLTGGQAEMGKTRAENPEAMEGHSREARDRRCVSAPKLCSSGRLRALIPRVLWISRWSCAPILLGAFWYLLIPPPAGYSGVNTTAPFAEWNKAGTYGSNQECALAKSNLTSMSLRTAAATGQQQAQGLLAIEQADCVSSDDFRLEAPLPSPPASPTLFGP